MIKWQITASSNITKRKEKSLVMLVFLNLSANPVNSHEEIVIQFFHDAGSFTNTNTGAETVLDNNKHALLNDIVKCHDICSNGDG
jgi:hypothetical protein